MQRQAILTITVLTWCVLFSQIISLADSRQSTERSAEQETRTQSKIRVETAAPESDVKTIPKVPKRTVTAPAKKIDKLELLKVKKVYAKNDNLHVVLYYLGREKLSPQDLISAQLIIAQGAKTDVVFLRNKMAQLQQLRVPQRSVDIDTSIKPGNGMVRVRIKGQRDTYTTKIAIKNTGPLEVPKKQLAVGTTPLEVPTKEMAVDDTGAVMARSRLWDISLHKVVVYQRGWKEGTTYTFYDIFNKYGGSGDAPKSVIYKPFQGSNYVIPFYVSKAEHSAAWLWFKVKPCIKFKSVVTADKLTLADIKKWNEPVNITWSLRVKGLPGSDIYKESMQLSPTLSLMNYDTYKESNNFITTGGEGQPEICMEVEKTFSYSQFEKLIPGRSTEQLYVEIEVRLDITDALDVSHEYNNYTNKPVLTFRHIRPDLDLPLWQINLLRPAGNPKHNKWFIGATKTIQWEEYNNDRMIKIDLYRYTVEKGSQFVGTISKHIKPSSQKVGAFSENYNWYDWQAGYLNDGGSKVVEPNDPNDPHDYYRLRFYGLDHTNQWRPLLMKGINKFTLHNFTKQFGNEVESYESETPDNVNNIKPKSQ